MKIHKCAGRAILAAISATVVLTSFAEPGQQYSEERFKRDVDVLVPFAIHLEEQCNEARFTSGVKSDTCRYSEAMMRVLREYAATQHIVKRLSGHSDEESRESVRILMDALVTGYRGGVNAEFRVGSPNTVDQF